ncbi:peptidoglycan O-acetyltransferase [Lachnospiraceae bacterium]|nr:peptidoglycan O-acetyltransferase [Lachnospiraceae bacterium]
MLFNSYGFVFLFFPLVLAGYAICQRAVRGLSGGRWGSLFGKLFLFAASLVFYGWSHPGSLPVLLGSMAFNYGLYRQMEGSLRKKTVLAAGVAFHLALLACFKYLGLGGAAPLGISFFTFTQIAFLAEGFRGNLKQVKALSYGLYVSFFPKVMQGPIALPEEMLGQFDKEKEGTGWEGIYRNLYLFVLGLFKKVLIADTLGSAADFGYANLSALNAGDGLVVMLSYTLQLYFDFSGYCDMAMGIGGMLGISLPLNFRSPYKASNILEFWKGWHITLTKFFTQYVYIPLGGSRRGKIRTYLNTLLVFFLSGIWHGAGWQFIVWGLMHGILYVLTRIYGDWRKGRNGRPGDGERSGSGDKGDKKPHLPGGGLCHCLKVFLTFLYVNIAWIFFRAPSLKEALTLVRTIGGFSFGKINWNLAGCFNLEEFWYVIKILGLDRWQYGHYLLMALILAGTLLLVFFGKTAREYADKAKPGALNGMVMALLFFWSVLSFSGVSSFLYVNF